MLKKFCGINKNKLNIYKQNYEKKLYKIYGKCDGFDKNIEIFFIADTHGTLDEREFSQYVSEHQNYDVCIMLGDHYIRDIDIIVRYIDKNRLFGLLGNHDYDYLSEYNIPNINGKILNINNVKILGMEGSFKYKSSNFPSFTEEESISFFENKEKVDILVSHDKKYDYEISKKDAAHQGLIGITKYLYENSIPYHVHGHIHGNYEQKMLNGTTEISVFGYKNIQFK